MGKREKMSTWCGWAGRILEVDLDQGKVLKRPLSKELVKKFVGGRGINMKLLFDELKPNTDPLSSQNVLLFGTGPLTGTLVGSRLQVTTKSPMTGFLGDSNSGGHWGSELKFAGYDHIIVRGRASKPVYLFIDDDEVEMRDASDLWGKNVWEVTDEIRINEGDPSIQVIGIGIAGENLVKYAAIINSYSRANGRTGVGAVMGSKNLKCIAVRGTKGVAIANPQKFLETVKNIYEKAINSPMYKHYPIYGTPILTDLKSGLQNLPVKNWTDIIIDGVENVTGQALVDKYAEKSRSCYGCFYHCDHFFRVTEGKYKGTCGPGLEYEAVNGLGPRVGNTDFPTILYAVNLLNDYGLDVVSTGGSIALAMDLFERGILTEKDTNGLAVRWGDGNVIIELIHKIAKREGFGNLLAEGPYLMAKKIGKGAEERVMHAKKLDPTAVETRPFKGQALSYMTSTRGADHLRGLLKTEALGHQVTMDQAIKLFGTKDVTVPGLYDTLGKPKGVHYYQKLAVICDCMEMCKFNTFWCGYDIYFDDMAKLLTYATGLEFTEEDLDLLGKRIWILEKAINTREGYTRQDDMPCERMMKEPIPRGNFEGELLDAEEFSKMLDAYYQVTGCDVKTGIPTEETLLSLGLMDIAEKLKRMGKLPSHQ